MKHDQIKPLLALSLFLSPFLKAPYKAKFITGVSQGNSLTAVKLCYLMIVVNLAHKFDWFTFDLYTTLIRILSYS